MGILATEALQDSEICLMTGTKPEAGPTMERLVARVLKENDLPVKLTSTLDRRKALEGADYVIIMIQGDGGDAFKLDSEIALKYGVDQCIGDSLHPGDTTALLRDILADMKNSAPARFC